MKQDKKFIKSLAISLGVHLLLVIALIWGTKFNMSKPVPKPNMVEAVVIDPNVIQQQAQHIRQQRESAAKAEQDRIRKLREKSARLEKNRKAEEQRIRRLAEDKARAEKKAREAEQHRQLKEKQRKQEEKRAKVAETERKKKEQQAKVAKQKAAKAEAERAAKVKAAQVAKQKAAKAEADRIAKEKAAKAAADKARKAEQQKIAHEKAAKEAAEKAKKEQARLVQLERERKEKEAALNDIFSGLEAEAQNNSTARSRAITDEVSRMGEVYKQMIQRELLLEDSYKGKNCRVNLRLLKAGSTFIVSDLKTLSGDNGLCRATKLAVSKVASFPLPKDEAAIEKLKNINLTVAPE
ncbi:protein TolA [Vibrio sp. UCD-FRSSP16_10]|uniref:cell envelope integrity protein TolA n=1 Tax=unclassified Vibrio TaxID=2614977 RepID=UPI0007FEB41B|nr:MULTISPECIES: cell envelope integrity protein TolA [unclassified Vibrio]OBT15964.1 protein TolA [Vibrio sp. UCD-FRSSP16_10]OBT17858.1 protein TolA [Vibrio sp. UCD-FRSSP16_30]